MAVIHRTTMTPGKLELLAAWLPTRAWYAGSADGPDLARAGGFRLDDPQGEVGIEFVVVTDVSGDRPVSYHVPLTYRGAPLDGADQALVGTSEHGVLGRRWVYDGTRDPVFVAQLLALLTGRAEPQAQSLSNTPDPSVTSHHTSVHHAFVAAPTAVDDGPHTTAIVLQATVEGAPAAPLTLMVTRVLEPEPEAEDPTAAAPRPGAHGYVTAGWRLPGGAEMRGVFAVLGGAAR